MIGIFTALPEELAPLLARSSAPEPAGRRVWRARIAGTNVLLGATGESAARAESRASAWIGAFGLRGAIGAGLAGGLSPDLRSGDVIAARRVRAGNGEEWSADRDLLDRAATRADRVGALVSGDRLCFTAAEKEALLARHPDAENAGADLESAGWARAAARARIPFVAIRAVLDAAGEELPDSVRRAWTGDRIDRLAVVARAIFRPREIAALFLLASRTRRAMERLADVLPAVVAAEA